MDEIIISADSHVIEVPDLWEKGVSQSLKARAPKLYFDEKRDAWMFGSSDVAPQAVGGLFMAGQKPEQINNFRKAGFAVARQGGWDPIARLKDMEQDGVLAEVLYPSLGLGLFCIEDATLQEALFHAYNDWLMDYCSKVPDKLFGIALISMFNIENAIAEMERCKKHGMSGTMIWQVPHPNLPFSSPHYERFWAASQDLDMPVHLHILTGFGDSMKRQTIKGIQRYRIGVNQTREIEDALFDLIFSGVLERNPRLKIVSVKTKSAGCRSGSGSATRCFAAIAPMSRSPSINPPANIFAGRYTRLFSMIMSGAGCFPGGALIIACGRMIIRIKTRHGPIPVKSSAAIWDICPRPIEQNCSAPMSRNFIT